MRTLLLFLLAAAAGHCFEAQAQSSPDCPTHPGSLALMRHCNRRLRVFGPSATHQRLKRQQASLDAAADDMMDRNVLYLPVLAAAKDFPAPLDVPYILLSTAEQGSIRKRFHIPPDSFAVVLLGEDGGTKLRSIAPVPVEKLNNLIDRMPTRKLEMQRPHTN